MKMGLLACTTLSALVSVAQAAQEPGNASGPLRLSAPQMDTATAGTGAASVWITSAAAALQRKQFSQSQFRKFGLADTNIQLVVKISGRSVSGSDSSQKIVLPSTGGTVSIGQTTLVGEMQ